MYEYRIEGIIDFRQRMLFRNHHRRYTDFNLVIDISCHAKKLQHVAELPCIFDISGCDAGDSFDLHIIKGYSGMECDGCQDRHLAACVQSFHIGSRICLCKSKLLSLLQCFSKIHAFLRHLGQNIVGCTIDNTHNFCNIVSSQTLL